MTPPSTPITSVIFDLDGTLIATRRLYITAFAEALEGVMGRHLTEDEIMAHRPRAERRFLAELVTSRDPSALPGVLEHFYRSYERRHEEAFEGVYRDVAPLLGALRERRVPLGLVTGKSVRAWEITSRWAGLGEFEVVVLDDHVPAPKPDPSGLRLAAQEMGAPAEHTVYVGDSLTDLDAAVSAGMQAAGVLWSKKPHERDPFATASRERGAHVLAQPSDLLGLLEGD
jgi:pyrophosphatase PpaX